MELAKKIFQLLQDNYPSDGSAIWSFLKSEKPYLTCLNQRDSAHAFFLLLTDDYYFNR